MIKEITGKEREEYNKLVSHPLQSWEWGDFRKKTGVKVLRRGIYRGKRLVSVYQLTIHPLALGYTIGYLPKGQLLEKEMIRELIKIGKENNCIFIKMEPNVIKNQKSKIKNQKYNSKFKIIESEKPLFTKYTFQIGLTKSEEELFNNMKSKTRYNIRVAQKHGVKVIEDNSDKAFEIYLKLAKETWQRQKFFGHSEFYHRLMWETLNPTGIAHLLIATYNNTPLVAWVLFLFNGIAYYPYGGSSDKHRNVMASNLIAWGALKWAKAKGAKTFDFWGALGKNYDQKDPWYGFHRFKEGYGAKHVEFVGSYDLVLKPTLYKLFNFLNDLRWKILNLKRF